MKTSFCRKCLLELPLENFELLSRGRPRTWCIKCKEIFEAEKKLRTIARKKKKSIRMVELKALRFSLIDDIKEKGKCKDCGLQFHSFLMDFDHLDPSTKVEKLSDMAVKRRSFKEILEEISKCELVCSNCHRIRTNKCSFDWNLSIIRLKTETKETENFCEICFQNKDKCEFLKETPKKVNWVCKECLLKIPTYPKLNKEYYNILANNTARRKRTLFSLEFKNKPCLDCGLNFPPYVMDFDHRNPEDKVDKISFLIFKENLIETELLKCDLVCSNCHRLRGLKRGHGARNQLLIPTPLLKNP